MEAFGLHVTPGSLIGLAIISLLTVLIKRRYFSPLSDIPGPFFASITRLWQISTLVQGDSINVFYDLHQRYGPFVRVAPNEVSVSHPDAPKQLLLTALHKVCQKNSSYSTLIIPIVLLALWLSNYTTILYRMIGTVPELFQTTASKPRFPPPIPKPKWRVPNTSCRDTQPRTF